MCYLCDRLVTCPHLSSYVIWDRLQIQPSLNPEESKSQV